MTRSTASDLPDPGYTALDAQALARLQALDPDGRLGVVRRVLETFQTSLARMLSQLQAEQLQPQADVVRAITHQLKSSAAAVGALPLAAACADVEARLRAGTCDDLPADTARVAAEACRALRAVEAMLRS